MTENQTLLKIPLRGDRAIFVTGSSNHVGPIVYVGEGARGMFPQPAELDAEVQLLRSQLSSIEARVHRAFADSDVDELTRIVMHAIRGVDGGDAR